MPKFKAIQITTSNQTKLASDYQQIWIEKDDLDKILPVDMFLVTDFGVDDHFLTLTKEVIQREFIRTGFVLQNDYFEISTKDVVNID